jgi:hypothetical protein
MSRTKPRFVDGHAFLYYERQIDGRWELSSPSKGKPWPEKWTNNKLEIFTAMIFSEGFEDYLQGQKIKVSFRISRG